MVYQTQICIIGAGPGGATAALQLAKLGIECIVADKAVFPRDKICGDGLSGKVAAILDKIDPEIIKKFQQEPYKQNSFGILFTAPNRQPVPVPFSLNYQKNKHNSRGFVSKRIDFDHFLIQQIRQQQKITLLENAHIVTHTLTPNGYTLKDEKEDLSIHAQMLIVANGAHSRFAKETGGISMDPNHHIAGIRAYYNNVKGLHEDGFIELHFLKNVLPGYFWIFPLPNGSANVGLGMHSSILHRQKINLKKLLLEIIETDPILKNRFTGATPQGGIDGYGLPLGSKRRKLYGNRYVLIGDAASLIDPLTGEGIGNAMYSGFYAANIAAKAVEHHNFSENFLQQYQNDIDRVLGAELKMSTTLQKLASRPWLFNLLMNKAAKSAELRNLLTAMFAEIDVRKKLANPLFYLKLIFNK